MTAMLRWRAARKKMGQVSSRRLEVGGQIGNVKVQSEAKLRRR